MSTAPGVSAPPADRRGVRRSAVPAVLVYLGAPEQGSSPDLPGLARAVERLVRSLAPEVVTRVTIALPPADDVAAAAPAAPAPAPAGAPAAPATPDTPDAAGGRIALADGLHLDLGGRLLDVDGRRQPLTRREFELMAYLQRRRGVAVGRRELMSHVWGAGYLAGDRTIDVHVRRLRVKLGRHHERITTLRGYGYRFD
jgi:DNA-binding response OmpR family regulator